MIAKPEKRRMELGNKPPFCGYAPRERAPYAYGYELNLRYAPGERWNKPYARFFERIENRLRYRPGPKCWTPGRYATSRWQPWSGYGRFSGLREILSGSYYAERYTGDRKRPEDYHIGRSPPEWIAEDRARRWRQQSWRMAA